jgi:hypothetical protein
LFLVGVLAVSALGVWLFAPSGRDVRAIDAVPDGAFLLATLDLAHLRESTLAGELTALEQVSDVAKTCGFDPLSRATAVAVGVPEKPDGVFGVAITTEGLDEDDLQRCAERVMGARSATPHVVRRGSWTDIEQEGVLAQATRSKIAYRHGWPVLVGRGDYLVAMKEAASGDRKRARDEPIHAPLRKTLRERAGVEPLLLMTGVLPKSVRERIQDESGGAQATMAAILAIKAFGLAVSAHGETVDILGELDCETEAACDTVRDFIARKAKAASIEGLHAVVTGPRLDLSLSAPEADLARTLRGLVGSALAPPAPQPSARAYKPDEVLRPRDAGP